MKSVQSSLLPSALCVLVLAAAAGGCGSDERKGPYDTDPLDPADAIASFEVVEGFRVELFAAEPDVVDPVEIAFDENGDVWVAEMLDYPFDPPEGEPPRSRIRFLQDTDGDGKIDRSTIFAENLLQVTSVLPWKGGVMATAAPDILYLKDTDGDHKADVREVLYTGFQSREVSPEARVTNLRYGVDNWIYAANNGRPGRITSPTQPDHPGVVVRGYDFRFHPLKGLFEPAAGPTQYGMSFDEWGNRFMSQNTVHLRHAVLPARYILKNAFFSPESMLEFIAEHDERASTIYPISKPQQWRVERTEARQKRYDETRPGQVEYLGGHFSAASGATVYAGDAFPEDYVGNVFVGEVNGNLIHRDILRPKGATFEAERWPPNSEFLRSPDNWFSPTNFANAPDGNLYVVDMYREYIEEPASIPEAIKTKLQLDFYRGDDRGRIYRIVPENPRRKGDLKPNLGKASAAELVRTLEHRNAWHRRTAQRLLVERQDQEAVPALKTLAEESDFPQARLHALWTLEGLSALEPALVREALQDEHPRIRENALRMAEAFLPELANAVTARMKDEDTKVRFQLALTLGEISGNYRHLTELAAELVDDRWFRDAILCSVRGSSLPLLNRLLTRHRDFFQEPSEGRVEFVSRLAYILGARRETNELSLFLMTLEGSAPLRPAAWRRAGLAGLARGLGVEGTKGMRLPAVSPILMKFLNDSSEEVQAAAREAAQYIELPGFIRQVLGEAQDEDLPIEKRVVAVRGLRGGRFSQVSPVLTKILRSSAPQEIQSAAADVLSTFDDPAVSKLLLDGWNGYGPEVRRRVVEAMLRKQDRASVLLDAVESGAIRAAHIDAVSRIRLTEYPAPEVKQRAKRLLQDDVSDRATVIEEYKEALTLQADLERGKQVFEKNCANCHLAQGERARIGPDLSGVNNKSREELLTHILDPSFNVEPNYTNYILIDKAGRIYDGLLVGETSNTVTLRGELEDRTILRKDIAEMRVSDVSLMPEGLEEDMNRQDMADVIEYLRAGL